MVSIETVKIVGGAPAVLIKIGLRGRLIREITAIPIDVTATRVAATVTPTRCEHEERSCENVRQAIVPYTSSDHMVTLSGEVSCTRPIVGRILPRIVVVESRVVVVVTIKVVGHTIGVVIAKLGI